MAVSADRVVNVSGQKGILEINTDMMIMDAAKRTETPSKFPHICDHKNGSISVEPNQDLCHQVQGQMNIYDVNWCDVLFRRRDSYDIMIIRVSRLKILDKCQVEHCQNWPFIGLINVFPSEKHLVELVYRIMLCFTYVE